MKSLLIVAGTGANNIVSNYIGDQLEDRLDYILIDSLESDVWKYELTIERLAEMIVARQSVILLATLGGETRNHSVEKISDMFCSSGIPFSAILVIPFKFEGERRERALATARYLQEKTLVFRKFDNEDLFSYSLPLKEAMRYADKEIGRLLEEVIFNHKKLCYERW